MVADQSKGTKVSLSKCLTIIKDLGHSWSSTIKSSEQILKYIQYVHMNLAHMGAYSVPGMEAATLTL